MEIIFSIRGVQNTLVVFDDRLTLADRSFNAGDLWNKPLIKSGPEFIGVFFKSDERTIPFDQIQSINYSEPTFLGNGNLTFSLAGKAGMGKLGAYFSGNSFVFDKKTKEEALKAKEYIDRRISEISREFNQPSITHVVNETSQADELLKFKQLLDSGVINQEEFDAKKKQILGL
jgi:hypothetical protein